MSDSPRTLINRLESLYARGEFEAVIAAAADSPHAGDPRAEFLRGLALASTGRLQDAAAALRRARAGRPGDFAVDGALARVLLLQGDAAGAEPLVQALAAAAPFDLAARAHAADAYLQAGRYEEAFQMLSQGPADPRLDARLAEAAIRTRRIEAGVAAARRAFAAGANPATLAAAGPAALLAGDPAWLARAEAAIGRLPATGAAAIFDAWTGVLMAGRFLSAALKAAERAARHAPSAQRWRLVADLRLADRNVAGAEEAARAALEIAPTDSNALSLMARCRLVAGDVAEAKRLLLDAVSLDPANATALDNLTQLDAKAMTPEMAAALERRLADGGLSAESRTRALLALARRDEAAGEFARAFERILAAKGIAAAAARAAGAGYRPSQTEAKLARLRQLFPCAPATPPPAPGPRFIFIVGMPRSGTSLVEQILAAHPDVYAAGERPEMLEIMNAFAAAGDAAAILREGPRWAAYYRANLPSEARAAVADKHPLNFWSIGLIHALLADARIVHLRRRPVDVCLSILRHRFYGEYDFANAIEDVAHYYAVYERMMAHWKRLFGDRVFDLDYDWLTADPEAATRALVSHCGLAWSESCLAFHQTPRNVITHSAAQVREPVNSRAADRMRGYGPHLGPLEEALALFRAASDAD